MRVVSVDFDGTLCVDNYPYIGTPKYEVIDTIRAEKLLGAKLILWTCREGQLLNEAIEWCKEQGLTFDTINDNIPERVEMFGNNSRKVSADIYYDDKAINTGG